MCKKKFLGFIELCLFPLVLYSQQFRLTSYERSYGLPTEVIKDVKDDENGFLWVATDEGVVRFDGQTVMSFREQTASNYIKKIVKTSRIKLVRKQKVP